MCAASKVQGWSSTRTRNGWRRLRRKCCGPVGRMPFHVIHALRSTMKITVLPLAVAALAMTGCASYQKPIPEGYAGPVATVLDSGPVQSSTLVHIYELTQVDGRNLEGSQIATRRVNYGRGFAQTPVLLSNKVPAKEMLVTIGAATVYAAPILALTNPTCSVK